MAPPEDGKSCSGTMSQDEEEVHETAAQRSEERGAADTEQENGVASRNHEQERPRPPTALDREALQAMTRSWWGGDDDDDDDDDEESGSFCPPYGHDVEGVAASYNRTSASVQVRTTGEDTQRHSASNLEVESGEAKDEEGNEDDNDSFVRRPAASMPPPSDDESARHEEELDSKRVAHNETDEDDDSFLHRPAASMPPPEPPVDSEKDAYRLPRTRRRTTPLSTSMPDVNGGNEGGNESVPRPPLPTQSDVEQEPGAVAMRGRGHGPLPGWATIRQNSLTYPSSRWVRRTPRVEDIETADIATADAVDNAETIVVATSVSRDQTVKNRRIVICVGVLALILIIGLATGLTLTKQGIGVDVTTTDSDQPDPRCVPPVQERDVFDLCHCGNSPTDLNLTANETIMYDTLQTILFNNSIIRRNYTLDSCSFENQCMSWAANYKRRNTTDEIAKLDLHDRDYLVQMHSLCQSYLHLDGRRWDRNDSWLDTGFVCEWFGVSCSFLSRVTGIQLQANGLNGSFPTELQHMPFLRDLDVSRNLALRGTIPSELSRVVTMHTIDLSRTSMTGTIPKEIGGLDILDRLVLSNNSFTGTIPLSLTNLTRMRELYLDHNSFSGTLHTEFGNLNRLAELSFGNNMLSGTLPTELGNLIQMEIFRVNDNRLNGTIPREYRHVGMPPNASDTRNDGFGPKKGPKRTGWGFLEEINLSNNSFTGNFPTYLGKLDYLATTLVQETNLTGYIPESFCEGMNKDRSIIILDCNKTTPTPVRNCSCCGKDDQLLFCYRNLPDSLQDLA